MRKSFRGCPPYEGEEPYLFLCFSEEDRNAVFPLLERLYSRGCRVWYSLKNTSKQEEMNRQQERIRNAGLAVLFLTDHVRQSRNVKGSLMYYQKQGKPVICIDTDDGDRQLSVGLSTEARHLDGRNGKAAEELGTELIHTEGFTQQLIGDPRFSLGPLSALDEGVVRAKFPDSALTAIVPSPSPPILDMLDVLSA